MSCMSLAENALSVGATLMSKESEAFIWRHNRDRERAWDVQPSPSEPGCIGTRASYLHPVQGPIKNSLSQAYYTGT